jgi:hypothetical protein
MSLCTQDFCRAPHVYRGVKFRSREHWVRSEKNIGFGFLRYPHYDIYPINRLRSTRFVWNMSTQSYRSTDFVKNYLFAFEILRNASWRARVQTLYQVYCPIASVLVHCAMLAARPSAATPPGLLSARFWLVRQAIIRLLLCWLTWVSFRARLLVHQDEHNEVSAHSHAI